MENERGKMIMKRIGIITFQKVGNYGADLQAYALQRKLEEMGYEAENIDYLHFKHPDFKPSKKSRPTHHVSVKNRVKTLLLPLMVRTSCILNWRKSMRTAALFRAFEKNIKLSRTFRSIDDLYDNPPIYDVFVSGGDQIWNPRLCSNLGPYFLEFAKPGIRCISYASSFGVGSLAGPVFYKVKQWLKRFGSIGVREESGFEIVKAMGLSSELKMVLDPTLLLSSRDWMSVAKRPDIGHGVDNGYLLLFDLVKSRETIDLAKLWAEQLGVPVLRIRDGAFGPSEFLWLFANARAVVTNSFHGTAFSIINHVPFYSVIPRKMQNSGRIESLLKLLGLGGRMRRAGYPNALGPFDSDVKWDAVENHLSMLRQDSLEFLRRSIDGETKASDRKLPIECYAAWNCDERIRRGSTSGGIFNALAKYVIQRNGVVFGAAFDKGFESVSHTAAKTLGQLPPLMQSKYVWSDPRKAFSETIDGLKSGQEVLFVGTPCQVAAVKKMAKGLDDRLLTVDLVCHGTPRPEIFKQYVIELKKKYGAEIVRYEFRNKDEGWHLPRVQVEFSDGRRVFTRTDPYLAGFYLGVNLRPVCFRCPFVGLEREGDFTIADCWRISDENRYLDDNRGTSLVLVNTEKASSVFKALNDAGEVNASECDLDAAQMRNAPLQQSASRPMCYDEFARIFETTGSFSAASACYHSRKQTIRSMLVYLVRKVGIVFFKRHI